MRKEYDYEPQGTCSKLMHIVVEDGILVDVNFSGGCPGNLQGIAALVKGMSCKDVVQRLKGIRCGYKQTSCPDQFSKALEQILAQEA